MKQVFIFAGTSEGRELVGWLSRRGLFCTVSVATEYGGLLMQDYGNIQVLQGRMDHKAMTTRFRQKDYSCVIDATHPFATVASREIRTACAATGLPYLRLARNTDVADDPLCHRFDSAEDAAQWLGERQGNILLTTGTKDLPLFVQALGNASRLYARVLPAVESIQTCNACGLGGAHIIAMQGPFSVEQNVLTLQTINASYIVTKESGRAGGFEEKCAAAQQCGIPIVIIANPERQEESDACMHFGFTDLLQELEGMVGLPLMPDAGRHIILAGIGPGAPQCLTEQVRTAVSQADCIFGAPRVLHSLCGVSAPCVPLYRAADVAAYLDSHPTCSHPLVVFAGDCGFYSGAQTFLRDCPPAWRCTVLSGLSSPAYFASAIGKSWQDWTLLSSHGRFCNLVGMVRCHRACFLLPADVEDVRRIGHLLEDAVRLHVLGELRLTVGYQLSFPEERISTCSPQDLSLYTEAGLYCLLIEHEDAEQTAMVDSIPDDAFMRGAVPMTKREVRSLIIGNLALTRHAVVYDVGAGTGSISVETARLCVEGQIYAIERQEEAVSILQQNKERFCLANMHIVFGEAPEACAELPPPTHVVVGGSGGRLESILGAVLQKNPAVRICIPVVTVETLSCAQEVLSRLPVRDVSYTQLSVSRAEQKGRYHLWQAQNPVCLIFCVGKGDET